MITRRVWLLFAVGFVLALATLTLVHRETVRRTFDVVRPAALEDGLRGARAALQESYARAGAASPELERQVQAIDRGLLVLSEMDLLEDELRLHLALYGAAPFALLFVALSAALAAWIRRLSRESLALASRSRALGWREVAREVVHEGKNVLTPLKLTAEGLAERAMTASDPRLEAESTTLLAGLRALERMTAALRDLSNRRAPDVRPVPVAPLLQDVVDLHRTQVASLTLAVDGDPVALADADLLRETLSNFVVNAAEAGATDVLLAARRTRGSVVLECRDDGHGLRPEHLAKVGGLRFTTKPEGTGLGLYLAEKLALQLGGRLEVESEPAGGRTIVRMVLPDAHGPARRR